MTAAPVPRRVWAELRGGPMDGLCVRVFEAAAFLVQAHGGRYVHDRVSDTWFWETDARSGR